MLIASGIAHTSIISILFLFMLCSFYLNWGSFSVIFWFQYEHPFVFSFNYAMESALPYVFLYFISKMYLLICGYTCYIMLENNFKLSACEGLSIVS